MNKQQVEVSSIKDVIQELTQRRKDLNISQSDLSKLSNLSINGISKFESNHGNREIKLSTLFKVSKILGFSLILEFEK